MCKLKPFTLTTDLIYKKEEKKERKKLVHPLFPPVAPILEKL